MNALRGFLMRRIKKLVKYLKGAPSLIGLFEWQETSSMLTTFTDSDWAGCLKTARSRSGGIVYLGEHVI